MAKNRGALKDLIQARGYGTDTDTAQDTALQATYDRVAGMRRWPWLEVANDTSTTATVGETDYDLAISDLLHIDAVRLTFGTQEFIELAFKPPQEFRTLAHRYRDNGAPIYWTRSGRKIVHLWRPPDKAYTLNVDYAKVPPALTQDSSNTIMPDTYDDILVWGAIADLCFRERDMEGLKAAKDEFTARVIDMMGEYGLRQRQSSSEVVSTGIWDDGNWSPGYLL